MSDEKNYFIEKLKRNREDYGFIIAIIKSFLFIFNPIYIKRIYRLYKINLQIIDINSDEVNFHYRFKILNVNDDDLIKQVEKMADWLKDTLKLKLSVNDLCIVILDNRKVIGFNLIAFGSVYLPLLNKTKKLKNYTAWSEHIAIHEDYRQSGLGSLLRYRIFAELRKRGIKWLYGGTLISDTNALKHARSTGFKEFIDIYYYKLLISERWLYKRITNPVINKIFHKQSVIQ